MIIKTIADVHGGSLVIKNTEPGTELSLILLLCFYLRFKLRTARFYRFLDSRFRRLIRLRPFLTRRARRQGDAIFSEGLAYADSQAKTTASVPTAMSAVVSAVLSLVVSAFMPAFFHHQLLGLVAGHFRLCQSGSRTQH